MIHFLLILLFFFINGNLTHAKPDARPDIDSLLNALNNEARTFARQGDYEVAIRKLNEVLSLREGYKNDEVINLVNTYLNLATALYNVWDYDNALDNAFYAYDLIHNYDSTSRQYGNSVMNLATIYIKMRDFEKAMQYINMSNNFFARNNISKDYNFIIIDAFTHRSLNNYKMSNKLFYELLERFGQDHSIYYNIASNYEDMGEIEIATQYYNHIFSFPDFPESDKYRLYINYGVFINNHRGEIDSTEYYYNLALENALEFHPRNRSLIALIYQNLGELNSQKKETVKSLGVYQKALVTLVEDFDEMEFLVNPDIEKVGDQYRLYRILKLKAKGLYQYYQEYGDINYLKKSLETSQHCFVLMNRMRFRITSEGSQYSISEEERDTYTDAITTAYQLYSLTGDEDYLNQSFVINETRKAFVLLAHLRRQRAMEYGKIPSKLIEQERDLNRKLSFYGEQILAEKVRREPDTERLRIWEDMLANFNMEYDRLLREFERNYPEYYNLKYRSDYISPPEIREKIAEDDVVVEYAIVDSFLYTFLVSRDFTRFYKHNVGNELERECNDFYRMITSQNFSKSVHETYVQYVQHGYKLYSLLLQRFEEYIQNKNLIIIADGEISYLPFDALLTEKADTSLLNYRNLPYLINRHSVAFSYSSTMHFNHGIRSRPKNRNVLAFAPTYSNLLLDPNAAKVMSQEERQSLMILPGIRNEVRNIAKHVKTNVQLDDDATESNFKKLASNYEILHLAMHTILDDSDPLYSRMAFMQLIDTTEDGYLHAYEVYNMQLNARLTVLSSCSSGFGKLQEGEGMQSIARSFAYAGCPSILMTLWEVADMSTVNLMTDFYINLSQGLPKHEALRNAKLNFIENADHLKANPFFWSSFIILGDTTPVFYDRDNNYWLWSIPVMVILTILLYRRNKKREIRKSFGWVYM